MTTQIAPVELEPDNLYFNGQVLIFADGSTELEAPEINYVVTEEDKYHVVEQDDNLRYLAYKFYKDIKDRPDRYWWVIAYANRDLIENPIDISDLKGQEIVIPEIVNFELEYING